VASPFLITGVKKGWKTKSRFVLLAIIILATLPFSWNRRNNYYYLNEAPEQALAFIREHRLSLPIYTLSEETNHRISYLSKMERFDQSSDVAINLISMQETDQVQGGLILIFEDELTAAPPETWWRVGSFGTLGTPRILIYEVQTQAKANESLLGIEIENKNFVNLPGALINAGLFCKGYAAWKELAEVDSTDIRFVPYSVQSECETRGENSVDIKDLTQRNNIQGYIYFPTQSEESESLNIAQVTLPIYDMRTTGVTVDLQPRTLYIYSIDVMTSSPTATLFWRMEENENYFEMRSYPQWTTVAILILTPDWETPKPVTFFPVLFDHLDIVSLRNFFIGPVDLKTSNH